MLQKLVSANSIAFVCYFMIVDYNDIYVGIDKYIYIYIYLIYIYKYIYIFNIYIYKYTYTYINNK